MNEHENRWGNTAGDGSIVGIQAEQVHNSTVYQVLPDASPREKYELGVKFLHAGTPVRARELIGEAIVHGHDSGEARFHWVLAMLSKRALRDLTVDESEQLAKAWRGLGAYADDEWKRALEAVQELWACHYGGRDDHGTTLKRLRDLRPGQRDLIVRHLDLVLTGVMKDELWSGTLHQAQRDRHGRNRRDRVWAYFHADPAGARALKPDDPKLKGAEPADASRPILLSVLFALAFGNVIRLALSENPIGVVFALIVAGAAGYVTARYGSEWYYRRESLKLKDAESQGDGLISQASGDGFTADVDRSFAYYFDTNVPQDVDPATWLRDTSGFRKSLRNEIVHLYRESATGADRVNWLIHQMVDDVKTRWEAGTLWDYRERYRVEVSTKIWTSLGLVGLFYAAVLIAGAATTASAFGAVLSVVVALLSGWGAVVRWLRIRGAQQRSAEDWADYEVRLAQRQEAYALWSYSLQTTRPSEEEMERWLNSDKVIMLDDAMAHYQLHWREVVAHAFLQTPADSTRRARVRGGGWRYSNYNLRLFLITKDGVREVSRELDFEQGSFKGQERLNYRFDAVASVQVLKPSRRSYTLELTLTNGKPRRIRVTDNTSGRSGSGDESTVSDATVDLDAVGFTHTLNILEGIAAEGKNWITTVTRPQDPPDLSSSTG